MMKWKTFVIGYTLALALLLFAQHRPEQPAQPASFAHIVDLTHSINRSKTAISQLRQNTPLQPMPVAAVASYNGHESTAVRFPTRLDAPARFAGSLWSVDQIPPERLFTPLAVIDVRAEVRRDPDYELSVTDIAKWEQAHGQIPQGAVVMAHTGWAERWNSARAYRNEDSRGRAHFPGFSMQATQFLVQGRNVVGLGIDTASIAAGDAASSPIRNFTLSHSVYQLQNIANLTQAPAAGGLVLVAPAKLQGSSSAPARVLALAR